MATDNHRLKVALSVLAQNLRGNGFDALKPVSVQFANDMADMATAALTGDPHELLDKFTAETPRTSGDGPDS